MKFSIRAFLEKYFFKTNLTCSICHKEQFGEECVCPECDKELPYIKTRCAHCGRKLLLNADFCDECKSRLMSFDKAMSVFEYDGGVKNLIQRFKYKGEIYLKEYFAEKLYDFYVKTGLEADIITFVPMSIKEKRKRGYNQSELIAEEFCRLLGRNTEELVVKNVETERQATLDFKERNKNLTGVFKLADGNNIKGKSILVIDDVLTTGATAENISATLKKKGASKVYFLTVASVTAKSNSKFKE